MLGEQQPALPTWLTFVLAYMAGLAAAWFVLGQTAGRYFAPDLSASAERVVILGAVLAPLAGLALFQLVFGLLTRRWRSLWFWLVAPIIVYIVLAGAMALLLRGMITMPEAVVLALLLPFACGLVALRLTPS